MSKILKTKVLKRLTGVLVVMSKNCNSPSQIILQSNCFVFFANIRQSNISLQGNKVVKYI